MREELPLYKTYDDESFLGFLDIHPLNSGNSLFIPKKHYRWVYDVPNFGEYWEAAKKLSLRTQHIVGSESINYLTLGYEVPHAHIRIIPRFKNDGHVDGIRLSAEKSFSPQELKKTADDILNAS